MVSDVVGNKENCHNGIHRVTRPRGRCRSLLQVHIQLKVIDVAKFGSNHVESVWVGGSRRPKDQIKGSEDTRPRANSRRASLSPSSHFDGTSVLLPTFHFQLSFLTLTTSSLFALPSCFRHTAPSRKQHGSEAGIVRRRRHCENLSNRRINGGKSHALRCPIV